MERMGGEFDTVALFGTVMTTVALCTNLIEVVVLHGRRLLENS